MRRQVFFPLVAAIISLTALLIAPTSASATRGTTSTNCTPLPVAAPSGSRVQSVTAVANVGGTVTSDGHPPFIPGSTISGVPAWCDVFVTLSHPGAGDDVTVKVSLPSDPKNWTGRLQATGGSAYLAGDLTGIQLVQAVKDGYVATTTDAGIGQDPLNAAWALKTDGTLNTGLLKDFASRADHDMTVVAKEVTAGFYGRAVTYSYWNGCSTGGREGYAEAQRYPQDYDGILADAPAVNWDRFAIGTLWSQAVFNEEHVAPTSCELAAFNTAAVQACDRLDGVNDGIIDNPQNCRWDPRTLIGTRVSCAGKVLTITAAEADAVRKIWAGPVAPSGRKLWYGPNIGADFTYLATPNSPFAVADLWAKYFVTKNPSFEDTKLTYASFAKLFASSQKQFHSIIGDDNPNLSGFRDAGGKLLSWQGQSDQLVPTRGIVDYRNRVEEVMGGNARVNDFYRLFLLPGVDHCGTGTAPGPQAAETDSLNALVNWVEKGQAPATLPTATADGIVTRNACPYPTLARYTGHGDPKKAASYHCIRS